MSKFISLNIDKLNCTGLFLQVDDNFTAEIKTLKQANDLLKKQKEMKIQLRTKIDGKREKKNL